MSNPLNLEYTPRFKRDYKRLQSKGRDVSRLHELFALIHENSSTSQETLRTRHRMHTLSGQWDGSNECHVCNAGDWLLVWKVHDGIAYLQRTGTHDEIFR